MHVLEINAILFIVSNQNTEYHPGNAPQGSPDKPELTFTFMSEF